MTPTIDTQRYRMARFLEYVESRDVVMDARRLYLRTGCACGECVEAEKRCQWHEGVKA